MHNKKRYNSFLGQDICSVLSTEEISITIYYLLVLLPLKLNTTMYYSLIFRTLYFKRMRWAGHVARMGEGRVVHRVLVGKPEGRRPLERPRHRWEDNIKMDLRKVGGGGDWMELAQDRDRWRALVNTVMNFRVP